MKENWKIIKKGTIIKHIHSFRVTWDSGGKPCIICLQYSWFHYPPLALRNTAPLQLLWSCRCLINNKTQCQPDSRLLRWHLLQVPATVCALGSCCSWCQVSGHWHASVALMAFGRGHPVSIYGHESMPLTYVSPVAGLLWYKAAVELCLFNWPKTTWVTPVFLSGFKSFVWSYL